VPRRKRAFTPTLQPNWLREPTFAFKEKRQTTIVEQTLECGDKFKVRGEIGWFIFKQHVTNLDTDKEWIDCIQLFGVKQERGPMRSFRPERVTKKFRVIKRRKSRKASNDVKLAA
jgi:hypothetical protein